MFDLPPIEIETAVNPSAAVIWLHGLGANGNDFVPIVPELNLPNALAVRFVFPNAPHLPVTINGHYFMPAWYDILSMDNGGRQINEQQLQRSADYITSLIEREITRGIPSERIVLAGFSQGGAVVYHVAAHYPKPLAAVLGLSTYFPTAASVTFETVNKALPIEIHHGSQDAVVLESLGLAAKQTFEDNGYTVGYRRYPMEHTVSPEQIQDIGRFLTKVLTQH
ncbi:alpha/beta hydrolase [Marinagarivorans algicola]|uniref:alpha/beta hydrolase n=1 Tax=Marinagarivorans algicola TaxID=1513270 RepID=UPI0006B4C565|nr:alpha/beta fold hydrolase [Marinagarivorans algicola]